MESSFLKQLLSGGPAHTFVVTLSLIFLVLAVGIWVLEFSGHTISRKGIVKNHMRWNARTIAIIGVVGAIYIAGRPLQVQFVPGIGGFNPSLSLAPVLSVLFGLPGAIGVTFSMPVGDAISGALTVGSVAGCLGHTFITWIPYKLVTNPSMKSLGTWGRLYLGILIGGLMHIITVCGWLDFTHTLPPAVAWGAVTLAIGINQILMPMIVDPILLTALFPLVRQWGMFHGDLSGGASARSGGSMRDAAAVQEVGGTPNGSNDENASWG